MEILKISPNGQKASRKFDSVVSESVPTIQAVVNHGLEKLTYQHGPYFSWHQRPSKDQGINQGREINPQDRILYELNGQ
jgi:hypothetical protein